MKFSVACAVLAAIASSNMASAAPVVNQLMSGFNLGANLPNGACKSTADWEAEFNKIKSWDPAFNTVKLFSTADCWALANAVPAAKATGMKIWAGIWAIDDNKFNNEKAALEQAFRDHGADWLAGINVGSESLYRKEIQPWRLAEEIYDVKGMVQVAYGYSHIPVGSADTWTSWVDGANNAVIDAVDVVLMNGFPYWQGASPENALGVFNQGVSRTSAAVKGKQVIIGETGWPTAGPDFEGSHPSVENLQSYWKSVGCNLKTRNIPFFWFSGFDEPQRESEIERNFGIATSDRNLKINLSC